MLTPNIHALLDQVTLGFEQNSAILDALDQEDKGLYPKWLDEHEHDKATTGVFMPSQGYLSLAIDLLNTCALDLTQAHISLATGPQNIQFNAQQCIGQYEQWIKGEAPALFDFSSCIELVYSELALRALDQFEVPKFNEQSQAVGQWLMKSPAQALNLFQRWETLFTSEPIVWKEPIKEQKAEFQDSQETPAGPLVMRPRAS